MRVPIGTNWIVETGNNDSIGIDMKNSQKQTHIYFEEEYFHKKAIYVL